jgi:hypothetical protein
MACRSVPETRSSQSLATTVPSTRTQRPREWKNRSAADVLLSLSQARWFPKLGSPARAASIRQRGSAPYRPSNVTA